MGGLVQQINLYRGDPQADAASANARLLLIAGVGALVAVLVLAVAGEFYLRDIQADREAVAAKLRNQQAALARIKETLTVAEIDPFLTAELASLKQVQGDLNATLLAVSSHQGTAVNRFSEFFGGLARNTIEGLWFSNVGLLAGGREVLLKGRTTEPALVPRLLQTLATERAFAGRTFREVSFERNDAEGAELVEFELRSANASEVGDAG